MVNAQTWLENQEEYNTKKKRDKVKEIKASKKKLGSALKIIDWPNLKKLRCESNQLIGLTLDNLPKLTNIWCKNNRLTNLTITNCPNLVGLNASGNSLVNLDFHAEKLKSLAIGNNRLGKLTDFAKFISLENLYINNNPFYGSLEPLKVLTKLKELVIADTKIDSGLEHLPNSLKLIRCKNCPKIKIRFYEYYNFSVWRKLIENSNQVLQLTSSQTEKDFQIENEQLKNQIQIERMELLQTKQKVTQELIQKEVVVIKQLQNKKNESEQLTQIQIPPK